MTKTTETHAFQAEVTELLDLMIHSLYSHREIFLRELISNASDALDKLRIEALQDEDLLGVDKRLCIRLEPEPANGKLTIIDNGIGMSREEVIENLGTIARSGTRGFLDRMKESGQTAGAEHADLIGQFGVGFYSIFMVAERVVVDTWRAGEDVGTRWTSSGGGDYTIEEIAGGARGTSITLEMKPLDPEDPESQDFTQPQLLRGLVRKYSDFVEYPVEMAAAHLSDATDEEQETSEEGIQVVRLNSMKPLWARPRGEVTDDEHKEFYRHLTHGFGDPIDWIHFKAEGKSEYTALLYLPGERAPDFFDPQRDKPRLSLYVKRVLVMHECEDLLPVWLRFVRGLVDSQDLPLNVSREILQQNRGVTRIRERLVKKVIDALGAMLADRREDYVSFWRAYGAVVKEGIVMDPTHSDDVAKLSLFESSASEELTTLDEYVARMPEGQEHIYCLAGANRKAVETSPHMEAVRERGFEVLYFVDPVDEWVLERLSTYEEKPLKLLDKGDVTFDSDERKEQREEQEREMRDLLEMLEGELKETVEKVRFSSRLKDSPAVLVDDESAMGPYMERLMRQSGQELPARKRILELNPDHPVLARLKALHDADAGDQRVKDYATLLHGQALLAEGSPLDDPQRFGQLVSDLMVGG